MRDLTPLQRTERIQRAVGVLERLVAACCLRPEGLKARADYGVAAVEVEFTAANASDSKRIVGSGRMRAFNMLATMMSEGCGKEVRIAPIRWASDEEDEFGEDGAAPVPSGEQPHCAREGALDALSSDEGPEPGPAAATGEDSDDPEGCAWS